MRITHLTLHCPNLPRTEQFYSVLLGFPIVQKSAKEISFQVGRSVLTFVQTEEPKQVYHFAFNIPHNQLEAATDWLSERLALIPNPSGGVVANFESWNAKAIYFYDCQGNILEFIARFDLDNASDKPFSTSSIECVSEIAFVSGKPAVLAERLKTDYGLSFFEKGIYSEEFIAMGDDHGLFILVATHRKWYPTDIKAEKYFSTIEFLVDGAMMELVV